MRRRFGQVLRIGIAPGELALATSGRWGGPADALETCPLAEGPGLEPILLGLRTLLDSGDYAGWPAAVVVADDLARLWQVNPPLTAARVADLEAAAALRFHHLYGDAPANWAISADWDARRPFLAAGLPRALTAMLAQAAQDRKLVLVEVAPHFVVAWNRWQRAVRAGSWFGVVHDGVLTVGATAGRRVTTVRAAAIPPQAGHDWLAAHLAREALRLNLATPEAIAVCGAAPASWQRADADLACTVLGAADEHRGALALALAGVPA